MYFNSKERIKNGQIILSNTNARKYEKFQRSLKAFVSAVYGKRLSSYYFSHLTKRRINPCALFFELDREDKPRKVTNNTYQ